MPDYKLIKINIWSRENKAYLDDNIITCVAVSQVTNVVSKSLFSARASTCLFLKRVCVNIYVRNYI